MIGSIRIVLLKYLLLMATTIINTFQRGGRPCVAPSGEAIN
jgi:hypothetical protein